METNFRPPFLRIHEDELIVDSFAGGGGASMGIEMALGRSPDIAINHDAEAIAMHQANHPTTRHFCESVWDVDPVQVTAGRPVGLAWFSPDCTFHSKARGGKPFRDRNRARRRRGLAWVVVRWAKAVHPRVIILENVEEFALWGPLMEDGMPDPLRRGMTFRRWLKQLENAGYIVETREMRASDYGAPTTRKRLFIIARCDGNPIVWPSPTHGPGRIDPFRTAAECIDWSRSCPSIFERQRPLAENTMRRIARGIKRYVIDAPEPFIIPLTHHGDRRVHPISEPLPTVTGAHRGELALISPAVVRIGHTGHGDGGKAHGIDTPLSTVTSKAEHLLVSAFLAKHFGDQGQAPGSQLSLPMGTVTTIDHHSLVACHMQRDFGKSVGTAMDEPAGAVTAGGGGKQALVASHLVKLRGGTDTHSNTAQDLRSPVPTLTAGGTHLAEVRAFLVKYFGTDGDPQLRMPLHTITTRDRFALVTVQGEQYAIADIGMRMLAPRELFRAQGFPEEYKIEIEFNGKPLSKTAQVRMCGNSVSPVMGAALVRANVGQATEEPPTRGWFPPAIVKAIAQLSIFDMLPTGT